MELKKESSKVTHMIAIYNTIYTCRYMGNF